MTESEDFTDAQVDAAMHVLYEWMTPPFGARVGDYLSADSRGEERAQQLAALRAADDAAEAKNRALMRRALQAAKEADRG